MRFKIVISIISLFIIFLLLRVYYLSVVSNDYYEELSKKNSLKIQNIAPTRGIISDINNTPLAVNELGFKILLRPHLSKKKLQDALLRVNSCLKNIDIAKLTKIYDRENSYYNQDDIEIIDYVEYKNILSCFFFLNIDEDISIEHSLKRLYPYNSLASHVIGYVGKANTEDMLKNDAIKVSKKLGKTGIEKYYDEILQGTPGKKITKVNSLNQEVEIIDNTKPIMNNDITLSIDIRMQEYLDKLFKGLSGAVVVMDVNDGSILAAGSYPEYNLNPFVTGITQREWDKMIQDLDHPFTNKLVNGKYPPGSVVKMGVGLAFLDSGKIDVNTTFTCTGSFEFGGRKFRCHNIWGHGVMNLKTAIRSSCDDYFYKGSLKVGIADISKTLSELGFGKKTGVDLPLESVGILPNRVWKQARFKKPWYQGETLITSIGQGDFLATPMQVALYTAKIASGYSIKPHFIDSIAGVKQEFEKKDIFTPLQKQHLKYIREAMYEVANNIRGTAYKPTQGIKINIAAKTGTAQVVGISQNEKKRMQEENMEYYTRSHAWINAYGPYEEPKYAVVVLVEHGMHGGATAGPIAKDIFNKLVDLGYIDKKFIKKQY
ncbi:penicillin-binding protein 2 [Campylobacter canadensis]|uniref:penicillin-binding protein 2 n=1 Tax=Campylobacter canadensis TaxID=449520 RepID=UPI001555F72F|nr:penicillin-binding protein 2 [Campylobacter canadensis]MBZ7994018.1 penicillin-binding protein 2 [Campylobacter canadensis]MBZ7995979.1 penicillin-binding protein 2 [Campylobacter canadensis]MBZ7999349.1 penicillin-binding protein 2 [Campylobacter canadensis]MBZ8001146.1 penicillin-binding protein 2 [Campylobacter canadensis]MBZ8003675.1 penicillin-binding protein 2 [Campylobacter canadensis]